VLSYGNKKTGNKLVQMQTPPAPIAHIVRTIEAARNVSLSRKDKETVK